MLPIAILAAILAQPADYPNLTGTCPFGDVSQINRTLTIHGGDTWDATGRFLRPDLVELRWVNLSQGGRCAIGIYTVDGRALRGHWGYADSCQIIDFDLCGDIYQETFTIAEAK